MIIKDVVRTTRLAIPPAEKAEKKEVPSPLSQM
jgi:hypothetical protein